MYVSHQLINSIGIPDAVCVCVLAEAAWDRARALLELFRWSLSWFLVCHLACITHSSMHRSRNPLNMFSLFGHLFRDQISFGPIFFTSCLTESIPLRADCERNTDLMMSSDCFSAPFEKLLSWRANVFVFIVFATVSALSCRRRPGGGGERRQTVGGEWEHFIFMHNFPSAERQDQPAQLSHTENVNIRILSTTQFRCFIESKCHGKWAGKGAGNMKKKSLRMSSLRVTAEEKTDQQLTLAQSKWIGSVWRNVRTKTPEMT